MRFVTYLGHPAHFHLFKHTVEALRARGHEVDVLCKSKDLLEDLLEEAGWDYVNLMPEPKRPGRLGLVLDLARRNGRMLRHCLRRRPDALMGTSPEAAQIGRLLGIPSFVFNEDDVDVVPLFAKAAYPFCTAVVAPARTDLGRWAHKGVTYPGYQKLAYLHPNRFEPDRSRVAHLFDGADRYFMLRFVQLTAHHDVGIGGFTSPVAQRLIELLEPHGRVWISAEGALDEALQPYALRLPPSDIHHALAFASLFVGDSQSMTVESAVLGTPAVRFSDFAGRIGVLEELEHAYGLTVGIPTSEPDRLVATVGDLVGREGLAQEWAARRARMLEDKADVTAFMTWLFEGLPGRLREVRARPALAAEIGSPGAAVEAAR